MKGEQVFLRATEPSDVGILYKWENDVENWLVSNTIVPFSRKQISDFIKSGNDLYSQNQLRLMISDHEGATVGCVDLFEYDAKNRRAGIGILIDTPFRGKGYAREALNLTIDYCFQVIELNSVFANILEDNTKSIGLFEQAGFKKTGTKESWLWDGKGFRNEYFYQLIRGNLS